MFNIIAQMTSGTQAMDMNSYLPLIAIALAISAVILIFHLWLFYRLFQKAGQAGWKALVPIYNMVVFLRLGGFSGWWLAINLLPVVGQLIFSVVLILAAYNITLNFNKPAWYIIIYLFFQIVWEILIVFDKTAVWNPYAPGKITSSTAELPVQTPNPQQTPQVNVGNDGQVQPDQSQTPPPATSAPIQDVMPPSNSTNNRPQ